MKVSVIDLLRLIRKKQKSHERRLFDLEVQVRELMQKQTTRAIGQVVETRETDGKMNELAFADGLCTGSSVRDYESIFRPESEILGPKKRRAYPHPLSPSGNEGLTCNKEGGECLKGKN